MPRACALCLFLSLSFFSFSFFCACFTPPLDFFRLFWSTLDCSATTNQDHLTGIPRAPAALVSAASPSPFRRSFLLPFVSPPSPRHSAAVAAAIAIRSLTNLFDKSPRLIGLTTRPRLFFPSVKFTVVTKSLVALPPFLPLSFLTLAFQSPCRHLIPFSSLSSSSFPSLYFSDSSVIRGKLCELVGSDAVLLPREYKNSLAKERR